MSIAEIDNFYLSLSEPNRSCMLSLRDIISESHPDITQEWKYRLPFFYLRGKMFCYLHIDKKTTHPYIGIVDGLLIDHSALVQGDRKRMKVFPVDPKSDLEMDSLSEVLTQALNLRL